MNMSFYTAAVGAQQQQLRMNVQANNIANINTYGYKAEKPSFSSLMYGDLLGIDNENLPRGTGARMIQANTDFDGGALADTGRPMDYAIIGSGFFALIERSTGEITYTRDGSFTMSHSHQRVGEDGKMEDVFYLSDGDGRFVMGEDGRPIEMTDDQGKLPIAVFDFANTDGMFHIGANRFSPVEKNGPPIQVEGPTIYQGMLEASNADLAYEMTKVIEAQRSFSYALRMVQTSDEITTTINGLRG